MLLINSTGVMADSSPGGRGITEISALEHSSSSSPVEAQGVGGSGFLGGI